MHLPQKTTQIPPRLGPAPEKTEAAKSDPVAIGTRGTVGSLIMQELDHFSRLNLGDASSLKKPCHSKPPLTGEFFKPKLDSVIAIPRRNKRGGGKRLLPSVCSVIEVANVNIQPSSFSVFAYRNLKDEISRGYKP